jgi:hypothetical protein
MAQTEISVRYRYRNFGPKPINFRLLVTLLQVRRAESLHSKMFLSRFRLSNESNFSEKAEFGMRMSKDIKIRLVAIIDDFFLLVLTIEENLPLLLKYHLNITVLYYLMLICSKKIFHFDVSKSC